MQKEVGSQNKSFREPWRPCYSGRPTPCVWWIRVNPDLFSPSTRSSVIGTGLLWETPGETPSNHLGVDSDTVLAVLLNLRRADTSREVLGRTTASHRRKCKSYSGPTVHILHDYSWVDSPDPTLYLISPFEYCNRACMH